MLGTTSQSQSEPGAGPAPRRVYPTFQNELTNLAQKERDELAVLCDISKEQVTPAIHKWMRTSITSVLQFLLVVSVLIR